MNITSLNLAIVDDNSNTRKLMIEKLKDIFCSISIIVSFFSFEAASSYLSSLSNHHYNLTFLDIEMPDMDGIQLAKELQHREIETKVIYVSNREDRVFDSLATNPFGFVRKSHFIDDIEKVIRHFVDEMKKDSSSFFLLQNGKEQLTINFEDIVYIETIKRKLCFHLNDSEKPIMTSLTFQSIEESFEKKGFLCCYKGILVNYRYIKVINDSTIILRKNEQLPLSRRKLNDVKARYLELMQDRLIDIY